MAKVICHFHSKSLEYQILQYGGNTFYSAMVEVEEWLTKLFCPTNFGSLVVEESILRRGICILELYRVKNELTPSCYVLDQIIEFNYLSIGWKKVAKAW